MEHPYKEFKDFQVKELICHYLAKEIERIYIEEILGIKRRRFCQLVKRNIAKIQIAFQLNIKEKVAQGKYQKLLKIIL